MTTKDGKALREGSIVFVQGFEFIARNVRHEDAGGGRRVIRFEGICTEDKRNDSIRNTAYNGGTYSGGFFS